jgi:osmotically-inducible protein OsmY
MTNRNSERGRESRARRDAGTDPNRNERYESRGWDDDTMPLSRDARDADYARRDENEESPYRSSGRGYESGMQSQYGGMQGQQGGMQSPYGQAPYGGGQYAGGGRHDEWRESMQGPRGGGDDFHRYGSGRGYGAEGIQPQQSYGYGAGQAIQQPWAERHAQERSAMTGQSYGSSYPGQGGYGGPGAYGQQYGGQTYGQPSMQGQGQAWGQAQGHPSYGQGYYSRPYEQSAEYGGWGGYGAGTAGSYGAYAQTGRNYGQSYQQPQSRQQQPQYGQSYQGGAQYSSPQGSVYGSQQGSVYGSQQASQYGSQYGQSASRGTLESQRGRGPKGYTRSDDRIREDVCERLTDDPYIDASDINLNLKDGVVTLEGRVDERWMKHRVEDLIDACPGVKSIENRLTVSGQSDSDSDTTAGKGSATTTGSSQSQSTGVAKRH